MATEFRILLTDRPGTLAGFGGVLGDARVNIEAIQGVTLEGKGLVRFVPNDPEKAARALDEAAIA